MSTFMEVLEDSASVAIMIVCFNFPPVKYKILFFLMKPYSFHIEQVANQNIDCRFAQSVSDNF